MVQSMLAFGMPGLSEWLVIGILVLILFGAKKIPEFAKGLGRGIREFKDAVNDVKKEVDDADKSARIEDRK